jgi:uncharacterized protein YjbJ (UPF0337 family)
MTDNNKFIPKLPETKTEIILNQEQQTSQEQKSTTEKAVDSVKKVTETVKEAVIPTVYASDRLEEQKEGVKKTIGYALAGVDATNPALGALATGATAITGGIQEGIGKMAGNEEMAESGKVLRESATEPVKDVANAVKKAFE